MVSIRTKAHLRRLRWPLLTAVALVVGLALAVSILRADGLGGQERPSGEVAMALQAYGLLAENYVSTLDSSAALTAAWEGAVKTAGRRGHLGVGDAPRYGAAESVNLEAYRISMESLLRQVKDPGDRREIVLSSIDAMARSLRDNHTAFLPPPLWDTIKAGLGPGFGYSAVKRPHGALVWDVVPGSAADAAGIRPGDIITELTGPESLMEISPIRVVLLRSGQLISTELSPTDSPLPLVDFGPLDGRIAYVRIFSFGSTASELFPRAAQIVGQSIATLGAFSPAGWIIDLRGNTGGSADLAAFVAAELGLSGPFLELQSRSDRTVIDVPQEEDFTKGKPLVVLVDENTASAAEILATALHDGRLAHVLGQRTKGSVRSADYFEVAGGALQISTANVRVGGTHRDLDEVGLNPDEVVELNDEDLPYVERPGLLLGFLISGRRAARYDSQLQAAIDYLHRGSSTGTAAPSLVPSFSR